MPKKSSISPAIEKPKPAPAMDREKIKDDSAQVPKELAQKPKPAPEKDLAQKPKPAPAMGTEKIRDDSAQVPKELARESKPARVMDYKKIRDDSDKDLKSLTEERKKEFGIDKSVDMVVKSGEQIRIGKETIPLGRILAEIDAQEKNRRPADEPLPPKPHATSPSTQTIIPPSPSFAGPKIRSTGYYGIYVIQAGDNLWNVHFAFLREYFGSRGITVSGGADEPMGTTSSGVGRILKYAEKMVYIFNLKTKKLSKDLNHLKPLERIVIFNLSKLDYILAPLTAEKLNHIRLYGQEIILEE